MIQLLEETNYRIMADGKPRGGKTFEEALDECLVQGWSILALELTADIFASGDSYGKKSYWRAVLHKADAGSSNANS